MIRTLTPQELLEAKIKIAMVYDMRDMMVARMQANEAMAVSIEKLAHSLLTSSMGQVATGWIAELEELMGQTTDPEAPPVERMAQVIDMWSYFDSGQHRSKH